MSSASTGATDAQAHTSGVSERPSTDTSKSLDERVESLLGRMTLEEKLAQLGSVWGADDVSAVEVMQDVFTRARPYDEVAKHGLGHLTRVLGTRPVAPGEGAKRLGQLQRGLLDNTRLGVPAIAHEECLTGFTTLGATVFPTPLAWGATFDPGLIEQVAHAIGTGMRAVGVHQGLSPVLDVVRDYRWGRVEETIGEDPYISRAAARRAPSRWWRSPRPCSPCPPRQERTRSAIHRPWPWRSIWITRGRVVRWKVGGVDDLNLLGVALGPLPQDRVALDGAVFFRDSDAAAIGPSDRFAAYLLKQIMVASGGRACAGSIEPPTDLAKTGVTIDYTCPGRSHGHGCGADVDRPQPRVPDVAHRPGRRTRGVRAGS